MRYVLFLMFACCSFLAAEEESSSKGWPGEEKKSIVSELSEKLSSQGIDLKQLSIKMPSKVSKKRAKQLISLIETQLSYEEFLAHKEEVEAFLLSGATSSLQDPILIEKLDKINLKALLLK